MGRHSPRFSVRVERLGQTRRASSSLPADMLVDKSGHRQFTEQSISRHRRLRQVVTVCTPKSFVVAVRGPFCK